MATQHGALAPKVSQLATATPGSDYTQLELVNTVINVTKKDRKGQQVTTIRATEGVVFKDHPHGVEISGDAHWKGVIPWANIKMARR
jgi:hypothetical protein